MTSLGIDSIEGRLANLLALIGDLAELESPTTAKGAVDALVERVEAEAQARGARTERIPQSEVGDHLIAQWNDGPGGVLLMTHLDTVHPLGTIKRMPVQREGRRLIGPGVLDMKASVAMALTAVDALTEMEAPPTSRLTLLCTSDEETGSLTSRSLIEGLAEEHEMVLCLEPGLADGSLKTHRKGIGIFQIETIGVPSHAGASPDDGVNAIVEMARQVERILELNDPGRGTTVNIGTIEGGTRSNVVPERCRVDLDVRIRSQEDGDEIERRLFQLAPITPGAEVEVRGTWNRPPMPRNRAIAEAYDRAQAVASSLGLDLSEGGTGGGSDANFVAPLDVPLLDGLGAIGGGAHSREEYIWIDSLAPRTALLAGLIKESG